MRFVSRLLILVGFLLFPALAFAQEGAPPIVDWQELVALAINSVAVVALVQIIKRFLPLIPGGVKQILALVAGPLLLTGQAAIGGALGYPIDFGPLIGLFAGMGTGFAAMGMFDAMKRIGGNA